MSYSVQPHRWQPTRLPGPWDSPGKNTGVGCHFLLQCIKVKSESEVSLVMSDSSDPMDCSLPGSYVHGIFQARVPEWGAIAKVYPLPKNGLRSTVLPLKGESQLNTPLALLQFAGWNGFVKKWLCIISILYWTVFPKWQMKSCSMNQNYLLLIFISSLSSNNITLALKN